MSQLFSGKDNQSFVADAKYRVPTMQNRLGDLTIPPPNAKHSTLFQGCFFMFLFLIPFTIRQQCIIYPHIFFTDPGDVCGGVKKWAALPFGGSAAVAYF